MVKLLQVVRYSTLGVFFSGIFSAISGCNLQEAGTALLVVLALALGGGGGGPISIVGGTTAGGLNGVVGAPITFSVPDGFLPTASLAGESGQPLIFGNFTISWLFSGLIARFGQQVTHIFQTIGIHTVEVTATNNDTGATNTATTTVNIGDSGGGGGGGLAHFYWTDDDDDKVYKCPIAGPFPCTPTAVVTGATNINDFAIDTDNKIVYYTNFQGDIFKCSIAGALPCTSSTLLIDTANIRGMALDAGSGSIYWSNISDEVVGCSVTDCNGTQNTSVGSPGAVDVGVAVDPVNKHLYWGEDTEIIRCSLAAGLFNCNGTEETVASSNVVNLRSFTLDLDNEFLYWRVKLNEIYRCSIAAPLNCDGNEELVANSLSTFGGIGLAVDATNGFIYWTDDNLGQIKRCPLTAGFPCTHETLATGLTDPLGITLGP